MSAADGVMFKLVRGPFQNNGASPWYAGMQMGTPGQWMKINIDSGTNISWVTSTLCPPDSCDHFGASRFDWEASETFRFTDCLQRPFSFGPWGTMQIETGSDVVALPDGTSVPVNMFFSADYSGSQFEQLNWDGGIGMPSSSAYVEGRSSFLFHELMKQGLVDTNLPYVSFDSTYREISSSEGSCQMGGYDETKFVGPGLFLPWSVYSAYSGVEYVWSSDMTTMRVGNVEVGVGINKLIALDTGASQFKGDDALMVQILAEVAAQGNPQITMDFAGGSISIGPEIYNVHIEAGPQAGQTLPQFQPLGLNQLALVGSVLLDHCYAVYQYQVVQCPHTTFSLAPVGVYLFNKPNGPVIIHGNDVLPGKVAPTIGKLKLGPRVAQLARGRI